MLAARGEAQFFARVRAKFQNPVRQTLRVKQFARLRNAANHFTIRVAGIFLVETADGGGKFFVHAMIPD
jgi:hypothetical protein